MVKIEGILLLILARIVHHSNFPIGFTAEVSSHPLTVLPIFHNYKLLLELKGIVTLDPTQDMPHSNGILPHINHVKVLSRLLSVYKETLKTLQKSTVQIMNVVVKDIDSKAFELVQVTAPVIEKMMENFESKIKQQLREKIKS